MGSKMIILYFSKHKLEVDSWNWFWLLRFKSPVWLFRGGGCCFSLFQMWQLLSVLAVSRQSASCLNGKIPMMLLSRSESTLNLNTETKAVAWLMVTRFLLHNNEVTERHITWKDKKQTRYCCIFPWNFKHHADVCICDNKVSTEPFYPTLMLTSPSNSTKF